MRFIAILLFLFALPLPAQAIEPAHHVEATMFSPVTATGAGDTVQIGLRLKLETHWDTYWRMPGDAGLAPVLDWKGSVNFKDYKMQWPAPHRLTTADLDNNIYTDEVVFPLTVTVEKPGEPLDLKLHLDLLTCSNDSCVPEKDDLAFSLPAGDAKPSDDAAAYQEALDKVPPKALAGYSFDRAYLDFDQSNKNYLVVEGTAPEKPSTHLDVFVEHPSFTVFGKPSVTYDKATRKMALRMEAHSTDPMDALKKSLSDGEFTFTFVDGKTSFEGNATLDDNAAATHSATPSTALPVPQVLKEKMADLDISILLAALLGGLILNLMPCVLPVLSLKVLSVVSHGGKDNKATIFKNFMASALGIICSFWLMAGVLASLKAAGGVIGWGIQFQHPSFLIFVIAVLLLFAANMWGFFEIPLPRFIANNIPARHEHEPTFVGHFLTGAFATLLATPCTAPFLGTAVGFALSRGTTEIFAIFSFLGLGLALPYILLAVSPALFRYMPKPGKWMLTLKRILSLALFATAAWLVFVLHTISTMPALDAGWQKFDTALIAPAVKDGKTVMVDVTADWCLTCKANKKFVLEQKDVEDALSAPNIVKLQADWTARDDATASYLMTFGRAGIPFNVVYGPGAPDGIALPELLTKKALMDALSEAAGE